MVYMLLLLSDLLKIIKYEVVSRLKLNPLTQFTLKKRAVFQTSPSIKTLNANKDIMFDYEHVFEFEQLYFGSIKKTFLIALVS